MKTAKQIMKLTPKQLRRLVAQQQVELADHNLAWAGSCGPDAQDRRAVQLQLAKRERAELNRLNREQP
jgi:hypothetical protein